MAYNGSDKHKQYLWENKQAKLTAGDNIELTPLPDGTVQIDALGGGSGNVSDVQIDGSSILDQDGVANITTMQGATSQAAGAKGLVPAPSVANKEKFLKGDGTWATPENTTYNDFTGATSQEDGSHGLVPAPQIADKDKYLKGDGTWGEVSGGGNVDDVQMNGQSIVTNKIANFNNYVELTQAQYDALPSSKLTDGVLYCIKDTGIVEGNQFAPVIYSLEEREIGTWTDGKPLYQKTIDCGALPNNTTKTISHGISNIDFVSYYLGTAYNGTQYFIIPFVNNDVIGSQVCFYLTSTDVVLRTSVDRSAFTKTFITLQYTKTTDVAGSGSWGTNGVTIHHYDGNEKIVGTWFGETLYEKTINCGAGPANTTKHYPLNISNFDMIFISDGFLFKQGQACFPINTMRSQTDAQYEVGCWINGTDIVMMSNAADRSSYTLYVTVRYTKS